MRNAVPRCGARRNVTCCSRRSADGRCAKLFYILRFESALHPTPLLLIVAMLFAGCGHKGPLYLPDQKSPAAKPAASQPPAGATTEKP